MEFTAFDPGWLRIVDVGVNALPYAAKEIERALLAGCYKAEIRRATIDRIKFSLQYDVVAHIR